MKIKKKLILFILIQTIILNNNLINDIKNEIKIPQNSLSFFEIKKGEYSKSIEIIINPKNEINFLNLFLILKSYSNNIIYLPKQLLITILNPEEKKFITFNEDVSFIKNITYFKFIKWINEKIQNDEVYLKENGIYSFIITFHTLKTIVNLKPIYPWNNQILELFWKNTNTEISLHQIIHEKDKLIEKLLKEIEELKKK